MAGLVPVIAAVALRTASSAGAVVGVRLARGHPFELLQAPHASCSAPACAAACSCGSLVFASLKRVPCSLCDRRKALLRRLVAMLGQVDLQLEAAERGLGLGLRQLAWFPSRTCRGRRRLPGSRPRPDRGRWRSRSPPLRPCRSLRRAARRRRSPARAPIAAAATPLATRPRFRPSRATFASGPTLSFEDEQPGEVLAQRFDRAWRPVRDRPRSARRASRRCGAASG